MVLLDVWFVKIDNINEIWNMYISFGGSGGVEYYEVG